MVDTELNTMLSSDERHWWYRGRRRILAAALAGLDLSDDAEILDAGCGSGRTLDELARLGQAVGVDMSAAAVSTARARGHLDVTLAPVEALPFTTSRFHLVTCLDVIEHTPDDRRTLSELLRVTRPGGHLLVTVPAYPSLWSHHDEVNLHYRRYRRRSLLAAATDAGWTPVFTTHFNALLLAPAALVRLSGRRRAATDGRSDLERTPARLDTTLELPLRLEAALVRAGIRLPAGLSLLALLRKDVALTSPRSPALSEPMLVAPRTNARLAAFSR